MTVSTLGRTPCFSRKRSHTASFTRSVTNSRLRSGDRIADTSTRSVRSTLNSAGQSIDFTNA